MELTEQMRYRLGYLALRFIVDAKIEQDWGKQDPTPLLKLQDLLIGSQMAQEYAENTGDKHFASQKDKLQDFIEAEYGDDLFLVVEEAARILHGATRE